MIIISLFFKAYISCTNGITYNEVEVPSIILMSLIRRL